MDYFLVDFENVKTDGIKDLTGVNAGDAIIIFYSEQCKNITLDVIESISKLNLHLNCYKIKTGTKNALDFQLSSYLGYLIGQGEEDEKYHIVSNDKGFDCLCDFWKEQNIYVDRVLLSEPIKELVVPKVSCKTQEKKSKVKTSDLATIEEITKVLVKEDAPEEVLAGYL